MKKVFAVLLAVSMLLLLCSCGGKEEPVNEIFATYSVKATEEDLIVEVQNLGGVYDSLYDPNGIHIEFKGKEDKIFDKDGNPITRKDLSLGDTLKISYIGNPIKDNPKTLKVVKIEKFE